jgi:hypothetical protein
VYLHENDIYQSYSFSSCCKSHNKPKSESPNEVEGLPSFPASTRSDVERALRLDALGIHEGSGVRLSVDGQWGGEGPGDVR